MKVIDMNIKVIFCHREWHNLYLSSVRHLSAKCPPCPLPAPDTPSYFLFSGCGKFWSKSLKSIRKNLKKLTENIFQKKVLLRFLAYNSGFFITISNFFSQGEHCLLYLQPHPQNSTHQTQLQTNVLLEKCRTLRIIRTGTK